MVRNDTGPRIVSNTVNQCWEFLLYFSWTGKFYYLKCQTSSRVQFRSCYLEENQHHQFLEGLRTSSALTSGTTLLFWHCFPSPRMNIIISTHILQEEYLRIRETIREFSFTSYLPLSVQPASCTFRLIERKRSL